ncbi:MAG: lysophospholipid acyltransferase family protein [Nannocystaceae bacterium]
MRAFKRAFALFVLWISGWKVKGAAPTAPRYVIIAAPHTSGWDLVYTLATAWSNDIDIKWIGKHTLFFFPYGWFFRFLGGIPMDRRSRQNMVTKATERFKAQDSLVLLVSAEATRKRTDVWKSGFYHIAYQSGVPIQLAGIHYDRRECTFGPLVTPTGRVSEDMDIVREFYRDVADGGRFKDQFGEIKLRDETPVGPSSVPRPAHDTSDDEDLTTATSTG